MSCLVKFDVSGPEAESFLGRIVANTVPGLGGLRVCPVLNGLGHVIALWVVGRYRPDGFFITAASHCAGRDHDLLRWSAPSGASVTNATNRTGTLTVAGPLGEQLMRNLGLGSDILSKRFGIEQNRIEWIPVRVLRLNWGPVPVWEIHTPMEYMVGLYERAVAAGKDLGVVDFGMRAMHSMRLESGLPAVGIDIQQRCRPQDVLLERHVLPAKSEIHAGQAPQGRRLVRLAVDSSEETNHHPWGDEPILAGDKCVGAVTSAFYGYRTGCPVGFGSIDRDVDPSEKLSIEVLGQRIPIRVLGEPLR